MIPLLVAFFIGVASSALVAALVYRQQRQESLRSERRLLLLLSEAIGRAGSAASTSMVAVETTGRLEKDVRILRQQVESALGINKVPEPSVAMSAAVSVVPKSGKLSATVVQELHRVLLGSSFDYAGQLRTVQLRIGGEPVSVAPADVPSELAAALSRWNDSLARLPGMNKEERLDCLTRLHYALVSVHPFFDGNGLVATSLLRFQLSRYLGQRLGPGFGGTEYITALSSAAHGNMHQLVEHISACLEKPGSSVT